MGREDGMLVWLDKMNEFFCGHNDDQHTLSQESCMPLTIMMQ